MKRRMNAVSILLFSMFLFLPIASIIMIHYVTVSETIVNMDAGYFGQKATSFAISDETIHMDSVCDVIYDLGDEIAVYQDFYGDLNDVRSIYFQGEYVNMPMLSGRFFTETDFKKENFLAVIGKKRADQVYKKDDLDYIDVDGKAFQVIGILGPDADTSFDSRILVNGLAAPDYFSDAIYTLDGLDSHAVKQIESFREKMSSEYHVSVNEFSGSETMASRIIPRLLNSRMFIGILLCDLLCIAVLSLEWKNRKLHEVSVKRLLGATGLRITLEICLEYGILIALAAAFSIVICIIFYNQYLRFLWIGLLIFLPCAVVFMIVTIQSLMKPSIAEGIK
mgnify:FL=1